MPPADCSTCLEPDFKCPVSGKLRRLYKTALRLEVAFFDAQHVAAAPARIGMLVTDFDDTCSASDTISTIIQTATNAKIDAAEASGVCVCVCVCVCV